MLKILFYKFIIFKTKLKKRQRMSEEERSFWETGSEMCGFIYVLSWICCYYP